MIKYDKVVIAGSFHYPETEFNCFNKWLEFLSIFQPEKLYLLGSLVHFDLPQRKLSNSKLEEQLKNVKERLVNFRIAILEKIRKAVPNAEIFYLQGGTEQNLKDWTEKQNLDFNQLIQLLELEQLRIKYVPEGRIRIKKLLLTHGKHMYKDAVSSAKAELKERGISGCSTCSHHIGAHYRTDYRGEMVWYEAGCFAKDGAREPGQRSESAYSERGFLVGYFANHSKRFHIFPVLFNGKLVYGKKNSRKVFFDETLSNGLQRIVLTGCHHHPFVHRKSFDAFLKFLRWFKPNVIYLTGDIIDFPELSEFKSSKSPKVQASLGRNLKKVKKALKQIREAAPEAKIYYLEGNHERRVNSYLLQNAPVLCDLPQLRIPKLLGLKKLGIRWVVGGRKIYSFLVTHGSLVRKNSGDTAKAELERRGISGCSSHTHRIGLYTKSDELGTRFWYEIGTLTRFDLNWVREKANWQRGFAVAYLNPKEGKKRIRIIQIPIINGTICFCGKEF